jgi:hypothetical protein
MADNTEHNALVREMEKNHAETGRWIDPLSGKEFPPGRKMKLDPNRVERRTLARWRAAR